MKIFNKRFEDEISSDIWALHKLTKYIIRQKGKQVRPIMVMLSAQLAGGITDATYTAACMIELLHTATLVHDDVVDRAETRRGMFSVQAIWKSKVAVLFGDYLLAKGLQISVDNNQFDMLKVISESVQEMSKGELMQLRKTMKLDMSEPEYYDIIQKKTATLFESCMACGALSAKADEETITKLKLFGQYYGLVFQIKDDILDYTGKNIGKPLLHDVTDKKITLPLIHSLREATSKERKNVLSTIGSKRKHIRLKNLIPPFVAKYNGVEYAKKQMHSYHQKATDILNTFPEGEARSSLQSLLDYTMVRGK